MSEEINWVAYQLGYEAWDLWMKDETRRRPGNPYPTETLDWKSWNKGWNANDNY